MKPEVIVVSSPEEHATAYTAFVPIQWEQQREEVRLAILYHRYACLKLRQLSREQAAINWTQQPGWELWQWSKRVGAEVFRVMFGPGTWR